MASEPGNTRDLRLLPEEEELKRRYLLWCEHTWGGGDCLRLLVDTPFLDGDARYALAMAIAHSRWTSTVSTRGCCSRPRAPATRSGLMRT